MTTIIIEGPDGGGKTSLAEALHALIGDATGRAVGYWHQGPYQGDPLAASLRVLGRWGADPLILDRFHLGEQVYGPIYRDRDALGRAGQRMLERVLWSRPTVVVLALPPLRVAKANWAARKAAGGEMFPEGYERVYDGFRFMTTDLPLLRYDYTRETPAQLWGRILARLPLPNAGPGAGHWAPPHQVSAGYSGLRHRTTLLVGEAPARPRGPAVTDAPFVARGGCSEWLAEQLNLANVSEGRLYWVNARDRRGRPTDATFLDALRPRRVVALGKVAEAWCLSNRDRVPTFTAVAHPQYHKRFKHAQPYALLEVLTS